MIRRWFGKAATLGLILALAPKPVGAQTLDHPTGKPGLSEAIRAEGAKLAFVETERPRQSQALSQSSSKQARTGSKARYGVAFGLLGMFAGAAVAENIHHGDGPTAAQLVSLTAGTAGGIALGIWLAGR